MAHRADSSAEAPSSTSSSSNNNTTSATDNSSSSNPIDDVSSPVSSSTRRAALAARIDGRGSVTAADPPHRDAALDDGGADGSAGDSELDLEAADYADALETPQSDERDLDDVLDDADNADDSDEDDDDDDYEDGQEFDELEDEDDDDDDIDEDDDDEGAQDGDIVLNLDEDQVLQLLRLAQNDDNDDDDNTAATRQADGQGPQHTMQAGDAGTAGQQPRRTILAPQDVIRFIRQAGWGRFIAADDFDDDDDDDDDADGAEDADGHEHTRGYGSLRARPRRAQMADAFPKVPSDEGRRLMESGEFGTNESDAGGGGGGGSGGGGGGSGGDDGDGTNNTTPTTAATAQMARRKKLAARIMRRELGLDSPGAQRSASRITAQSLIPQSRADTIIHYNSRCYSGQFSDDGNFFFSCSQDFRVRMYDSSNPYAWRYYKQVQYPYGQWTITDASLSPDNRYLAYSSIRSLVCLASTDPNDDAEPHLLDLADHGRSNRRAFGHGAFGIWSVRFSGDGRELVAGTSDNSVYAYDIETRQSVLRIHGHYDDVNAVCFGDRTSPHLLYSGSDDTTIKVWDRRSMSDSREAGVFLGHTEGITYVDSKGDGRYVLSNGKDQSMKLWDLRRMMSADDAEKIDTEAYSTGFDYRFQSYNDARYRRHPHDASVVTFRGHKVLKTLIRCHFSPPGSTDSRYVYSGSEDGCVYIYNLDATLAGKVNVTEATRHTAPGGAGGAANAPAGQNGDANVDDDDDHFMGMFDGDGRAGRRWKTCVRDASWHPYAPVIAATSWNGPAMTQGTCTTHTWNDGVDDDEAEPAMGQRVDETLRPSRGFLDEDLPPSRQRGGAAAQANGNGNGVNRAVRGGRRVGYDV